MKSKLKAMLAITMAASMAFAMAATAGAAEGTANLKINTVNEEVVVNTFTAYQVMTATAEKSGVDDDGNDTYVYTYTVTAEFEKFFEEGVSGYTLTADNEIIAPNGNIITTDDRWTNTNATEAAALATALKNYAKDNEISGTVVNSTTVTGAEMGIGYYVVVETETVTNGTVASKPVLVNLLEDATITPKDDEIPLEKKIVEGEKKVDANNVSIGDVITYEVTSSIPVYEANVDATTLYYAFSDTFTNIKFNEDVTVYVGDEELAPEQLLVLGEDYTIVNTEDSFTLDFKADAILAYQGMDVTLKYTGTLLETANVDSTDGNPNHVKLEYTRNPNQEDGHDTLEDEVITYTYGFKIRKVDKNDDTKDMAGATFEVKDAEGNVIGSFAYGDDGSITNTKGVITLEGNYATIKGVDEGTYTITETKAPEGYSLLGGDVEVKIVDEGTDQGNEPTGVATVTVNERASLEIRDAEGKVENLVSEIKEDGNGTIDVVVRIENVRGISLPETGSTGMLICLAGGAAAVILGAVYFALTRKSRRAE